MSAVIKVTLRCDAFDSETSDQCAATAEGELDLRDLDLRDLAQDEDHGAALSAVDYPKGWSASYESNYSAPGEFRVRCPKHKR